MKEAPDGKKLLTAFDRILIGDRDIGQPEERLRIGYIGGWSSIAGNAVLALLKFTIGLAVGSASLLANAVHTASDILTSAVIIIGFKLSSKEPDQKHPYGHGRIEYLVGLIIAMALIGVGIGFIIDAYRRLLSGVSMRPSLLAVIVAVFSVFLKELMYRFTANLGRLIESEALLADAWHHRSDAFTSLLVVAAVLGSYFRIGWLDAVGAFCIAGFIIYTGAEIAYRAVNKIIGVSPPAELLGRLEREALKIEGVMGVHDLEVHDYGMRKYISLHIKVDSNTTLHRAHEIVHRVQDSLEEKFNHRVTTHLDLHD
ncbi:MAG: cation transporter [Firmicutes bacterium]|jgi:cation diffusion facilitator family transporter|nr:cation transporter [Bacillota bacterium]